MSTMTMNVSVSGPVELGDLATLVAGARAVSAALRMVASPHPSLRRVSRHWIEQHGEEASRVLASLLSRPVNLEELARGYAGEEPPLLAWESDLLRGVFETRSDVLTPRELAVLRMTLGFDGQPLPLGEVGASMGVTRERVRQIESAALSKLDLHFPKGLHKSAAGRCRRSRLALAATCGAVAREAGAAAVDEEETAGGADRGSPPM